MSVLGGVVAVDDVESIGIMSGLTAGRGDDASGTWMSRWLGEDSVERV